MSSESQKTLAFRPSHEAGRQVLSRTRGVVVSGAGGGIGRAIACAFAARGYPVALLGRTASTLQETATQVEKHGQETVSLVCDVASSLSVTHAAETILTRWGPPLVVVNNAGIVHRATLHTMEEAAWDAVIDTNLKGVFLLSKAFLPAMLTQKEGRLVAVSSIAGQLGTPRYSAYCASKWGVLGLTKALAEELRGTGLQTMCVLPGSVDTPMLQGSAFLPQMSPEEVAGVVVYAALDAPPAMNGSSIEIFGP